MAVRKRAINRILAVIRGKQGHNRALRMREFKEYHEVHRKSSSSQIMTISSVPMLRRHFTTNYLDVSQSKAMQIPRYILIALVYTVIAFLTVLCLYINLIFGRWKVLARFDGNKTRPGSHRYNAYNVQGLNSAWRNSTSGSEQPTWPLSLIGSSIQLAK